MAENSEGGVGILSTMNVKKLNCDPAIAVAQKKSIDLCRIWGFVTDIKAGVNPRDGSQMIALVGDFMGVNLETGEMARSGRLFLPGGIHETLAAPFQGLKDDDDKPRLKFGFTIASFPSTAPIGYSYKATPFEKPSDDDPLAELTKAALAIGGTKVKALAPPTKKK